MGKRIILLFMFCLGVLFGASAQVLKFKNTYKVTDDGVKTKGNGVYTYIVFYNNKGKLVFTDQDGNKIEDKSMYTMDIKRNGNISGDRFVFNYIGEQNGMLTYYSKEERSTRGFASGSFYSASKKLATYETYIYFSKDFTKYQIKYIYISHSYAPDSYEEPWMIFEYVDPESEKPQAPMQMW